WTDTVRHWSDTTCVGLMTWRNGWTSPIVRHEVDKMTTSYAEGFGFDHGELDDEAVELVATFLQDLKDWAEMWNHLEPAERVKVGITKRDVARRIEQLQTGNPFQICCERSFRSPVARQIEHWVHRTSQVEQLEWLRLARSEIPGLVKRAQLEGERLARIEEARARWSRSKSNGIERQPGAEERRLHEAARGVLAELWPVKLRLECTKRS